MSLQVDLPFVLGFLNVTLIDVALSGDNAIVIGMAAALLPKGRRAWVIAAGGALAIVLRVVLSSGATLLLLLPYVSVVGGLALFWIVYKLVGSEAVGAPSRPPREAAATTRKAILYIVAADFTMSLDNVIAVAGAAGGNIVLLVAGLLISMPLLMTAGGFVSLLIDKARWLVYAGAAAISFTATRMLLGDRALRRLVQLSRPLEIALCVALAFLAPLAFHVLTLKKAEKAPRPRGKTEKKEEERESRS